MSDSSLSDNAPDDTVLEKELRQVVAHIYRNGKTDELTVNGVRNTAQDNLGLREGFFKGAGWKERSKAIIEEEAEKHNNNSEPEPKSSPVKSPANVSINAKNSKKRSSSETEPDPKPKKRRMLTKAKTAAVQEKEEEDAVTGESDQDVAVSSARKPQRKLMTDKSSSVSDVDQSGSDPDQSVNEPKAPKQHTTADSKSELSELEDEVPKRKMKKDSLPTCRKVEPEYREEASDDTKPVDDVSESELSEPSDEEPQPRSTKKSSKKMKKKAGPKKAKKNRASTQQESESTSDNERMENGAERAGEASESELSVLIDDETKPKRRKKGSKEVKQKPEPKKRGKKATPKSDLNPDAEEIKRLQGWLVKCGMRKMWARELKPYDTAKEKIRHLKGMLSDVGMTGRFSVEKAARIREMRELQADLTAVQEGEKRWGKRDGEEEEKPKRVSRGLPNIDDFGSESE